MKQTNNAIKFLMAQYRAIFKNANIAMVAAIAAAALAAGQAQAAPAAATDLNNANLTTALTDAADGVEIVVDGAGVKDQSYKDLTITGTTAGVTFAEKPFTLTITSGAGHKFNGTQSHADKITAKGATLNISGSTTDAKQTVVTIGGTSGAVVTIKDASVTKGTIALDNGSKLVLEGEKGISFGETSVLTMTNGSVAASAITLNSGSAATVTKGTLGQSGATITVNKDATLTGSGAASGDAVVHGTVNVSGGTVTVAATHLKIDGPLAVNTGKVTTTDAGGSITVTGDANFDAADSLTNSGTLVLAGNSTFAKDSVNAKATGGTVKFGGTATMSKATLETLLGGAAVGAVDGKHAVIDLSSESAAVALAGASTGPYIFKEDDGALNTKLSGGTGGSLTLKGKEATFTAHTELNGNIGLSFDTMTLGKTSGIDLKGGVDLVVGKLLTVKADSNAVLKVTSGSVTLDGASGSVAAKTITLNGTAAKDATFNVNQGTWGVSDLTLTKGNALVSGGSTLNVGGNLTLTEGTFEVKDKSTLNLAGNLTTAGAKGKLVADSSVVNTISGGTVTLAGQGLELKNTAELKLESKDFATSDAFDHTKITAGSIAGDTTTVVSFDDGALKISEEKFKELVTQLGDTFKGTIKVDLTDVKPLGPDSTLDDVANKAATNAYDNAIVKHNSTKELKNINKSVGGITLTSGTELKMGADSALTLNTAKDGKLVAATSGKETVAGDVKFTNSGTSIVLAGDGEIGSIKNGHTATTGLVTVGKSDKASNVTVSGSIGEATQNKGIESLIVNKGSSLDVTGSVYTNALDLRADTALTAGNGSGDVVVAKAADIMGDLTAGSLSFGAASEIAGDAVVDVKTLNAGAQTLTVGNADAGATIVADTFVLSGGKLFVDPAYGNPASKIVVDNITDQADKTDAKLNGDILIGQNSVVSVGYTQDEFDDIMADYLVQNGGFSNQLDGNVKNGVKNALLLNKQVEVAGGKGIVLDPEGTTDPNTLSSSLSGNALVMKSGSALIVSDEALGANKDQAAIKFATDGTVSAVSGSKVVLLGSFDENDTAIKVAQKANGDAIAVTGDLVLEYAGGLLLGEKQNNGTYKMVFQQDKAGAIYDGVSRPVADAIVGKLKGQFKDKNAAGYGLLSNLIATQNYKAVDAAAHAATYAGAQQAAVAAVTTMADAMFGRVGAVGVEAASISATGSQANGGVWLTPMYKSVDSDGFNAEGASYGADVDLSGVAFGTDTVNGNMRFGAVFNIGSGDAEGKGNGNGLKDEFDYYGFGIYSAMGFGNFALVGDASMTVISHEVEGLGLRGKADTTAVTMGVTGQYTVATPVVDVTPHLGARFIRLNTDSYDLISANGVEGTTDFDVQNVFSVPLGVTLSKGFTTGGWTLAPSADLTIAFNTGDTEAKSNTLIAGKNIGLNTEVLDEVTYGVTLGLGAQYGAFGTSFGINYTGSSNTDSFGVNAQARYMF